MLKQRFITAVVLVAALLASLWALPLIGMAAVFALVMAVASWEWSAMSGFPGRGQRSLAVVISLVAMAGLGISVGLFEGVLDWAQVQSVMHLACLWWAIALLWVMSYPGSARLWSHPVMLIVMGALSLLPTWLAFTSLRALDQGVLWILFLIGIVAAADIGAYFFGRAFGRAKLAPAVSPGKSWAGFWGGQLTAALLVAGLWSIWPGGMPFGLGACIAIALATALASVLGDLLESAVKREAGLKDSGTILPGHGGVMDRIDSLCAAAPVFTLGFILAGGVG